MDCSTIYVVGRLVRLRERVPMLKFKICQKTLERVTWCSEVREYKVLNRKAITNKR